VEITSEGNLKGPERQRTENGIFVCNEKQPEVRLYSSMVELHRALSPLPSNGWQLILPNSLSF
jgi:hypothetical protein